MKILVAYDGSMCADTAIDDLQWAGLPQNAHAIVLTVVEERIPAPRSYGMVETDFSRDWTEQVAAAERCAEIACNRLYGYFPQCNLQLEALTGNPATVILHKANAWPADLVVVGVHGRSRLERVVLGSVSLKLVREAPCSVRVGRASKHDGPIRLLIGNDGSTEADAAVSEVCGRSWPAGTEARVFGVLEALTPVNAEPIAIGQGPFRKINEQERHLLKSAAEQSVEKLQRAGLAVSSVIEEGNPKEALVEGARNWNADTIFVGARGLGRVERILLGSVSSATVAHAPCTVEVVRRR